MDGTSVLGEAVGCLAEGSFLLGWYEGTSVGSKLVFWVGDVDGLTEGTLVGESEGISLGSSEGTDVGILVGVSVGIRVVGTAVEGIRVGSPGIGVGSTLVTTVGVSVGASVGTCVGDAVEGTDDGCRDGVEDG